VQVYQQSTVPPSASMALVPVLAFLEPSLLMKAVKRFLSSTEKTRVDSEVTYNVLVRTLNHAHSIPERVCEDVDTCLRL